MRYFYHYGYYTIHDDKVTRTWNTTNKLIEIHGGVEGYKEVCDLEERIIERYKKNGSGNTIYKSVGHHFPVAYETLPDDKTIVRPYGNQLVREPRTDGPACSPCIMGIRSTKR